MTQWNPVWLVEIDGVEYTDAILANLVIRSGRTNIYEQAQAGYVNLQLIDVNQTAIPVSINSTIGVSVKNTAMPSTRVGGAKNNADKKEPKSMASLRVLWCNKARPSRQVSINTKIMPPMTSGNQPPSASLSILELQNAKSTTKKTEVALMHSHKGYFQA